MAVKYSFSKSLVNINTLNSLKPLQKPIEAWVGNMSQIDDKKQEIVHLNPNIFAVNPRIDILFRNVYWQSLYGKIDYRWIPTRAEMIGRNKKPWPQKGLGKARHASRLSPQWLGGGVAHGPRGPKSYFFMEPFYQRLLGLRTALTFKFHQNDMHIVDSLEIPTEDPNFLRELIYKRYWGPSVLFIDDNDVMPYNITSASVQIKGLTLMPTYGLNVYSMLKHNTLVMTKSSLNSLEQKISFYLKNQEFRQSFFKK